jgi:hypothetical protein
MSHNSSFSEAHGWHHLDSSGVYHNKFQVIRSLLRSMHKTDAAASFRASWLENASELLLENQFFVLFSDFVTFFSFFFKREGELPSPHISLNDCLVLLFSRSSC